MSQGIWSRLGLHQIYSDHITTDVNYDNYNILYDNFPEKKKEIKIIIKINTKIIIKKKKIPDTSIEPPIFNFQKKEKFHLSKTANANLNLVC